MRLNAVINRPPMAGFAVVAIALNALVCAPLFATGASSANDNAVADGAGATAGNAGVLIPREVYVGDTAEFSFTTGAFNGALEAGAEITVPAESVSVSADATVSAIVVRRDASFSTVTVRFVPWSTGLLRLPAFTLKKIRVIPPPVRIYSIVEKTGISELEPPRSPLLVPGTTLILYALVAASTVALAAALVFVSRLRRYLESNQGKIQSSRRLRFVMRDLRGLEHRIRKVGYLEWYALFAATLRRYFGNLLGEGPSSVLSLTASEIALLLRRPEDDVFAQEKVPASAVSGDFRSLAANVESLLAAIDGIRFSGRDHEDSRASDIAEARDLIGLLEKAAASVPGGEG